ncbi:MAG: hypothetical protein KF847_01695 [Pirellulales bacterium]|nr:hypothetical protein [Pirellulales bacterium]
MLLTLATPVVASSAKDRLLQEAPAAWKAYRAEVSRIGAQIEAHVTLKNMLAGGKLLYDSQYEVTVQSPYYKRVTTIEVDRGDRDPKKWVSTSGKDYDFRIVLPGEAKVWAINDVTVNRGNPPDSESLSGGKSVRALVMSDACRGMMLRKVWIDRLFAEPLFRIDEASEITGPNGVKMIEVRYTFEGHDDHDIVGGGVVRLLPERYWQIASAEVDMHWSDANGRMIIENSYEEMDGLPVIAEHHSTEIVQQQGKTTSKAITTYELHWSKLTTPVLDSEFRLTHYGLDEPRLPRKLVGWYFAGLAIACAVVAWLLSSCWRAKQ